MYHSTRNSSIKVTASEAIIQGLSPDGGLFVPEAIPKLTISINELSKKNYLEIAYEVLRLYLTDYTEDELKDCISKAYDEKFDVPDIAPKKKLGICIILNYSMELP